MDLPVLMAGKLSARWIGGFATHREDMVVRNPDLVLVAAMGRLTGRTKRGFFRRRTEDKVGRNPVPRHVTRPIDLCFFEPEIRAWCTRHCGTASKAGTKGTSTGLAVALQSRGSGLHLAANYGSRASGRRVGASGSCGCAGNPDQRVYVIVEAKEKKDGLYGRHAERRGKATETSGSKGFGTERDFVDPKKRHIVYVHRKTCTVRMTAGTLKAIKGAPGGR